VNDDFLLRTCTDHDVAEFVFEPDFFAALDGQRLVEAVLCTQRRHRFRGNLRVQTHLVEVVSRGQCCEEES